MTIGTKTPSTPRSRLIARAPRYQSVGHSRRDHRRGSRFRFSLIIALVLIVFAASAALKGRGFKSTVISFARDLTSGRLFLTHPSLLKSDPSDNETQVANDQLLTVTVQLPNGSLDENSV